MDRQPLLRRLAPGVLNVNLLLVGLLVAAAGCDTTNRMDRELKREADRHRIQLNRTRTELETTQSELQRAKKDVDAANARADTLARDVADLRARLVRTESELLETRRRLRQVEDAALAAGVSLPSVPQHSNSTPPAPGPTPNASPALPR